MNILVLNVGSSSIKFQLFHMPAKEVRLKGAIEKIGEKESKIIYSLYQRLERPFSHTSTTHLADHQEAFIQLAELLLNPETNIIQQVTDIIAIGHRVVHGGEQFQQPMRIDPTLLQSIRALSFLAPLHNPANLLGIEMAQQSFPHATQIAVFDTAFHQSIPAHVYRYAVPNELYEQHALRVYGFHGTSHQYVAKKAAQFLDIHIDQLNAISIHLGNGCSITAIKGGKSVDTSMGLTPLGGLMMGTRSGDIDPSLIQFLSDQLQMSLTDIYQLLNKQSGLKGITGENDMRIIMKQYEQNDPQAILAIRMYVYRIRKYLGAYLLVLKRTDAIIFTAGVGEHSSEIRALICEALEPFGIVLDAHKNRAKEPALRDIQTTESQIKLLIIPTNEELEIVHQMESLL